MQKTAKRALLGAVIAALSGCASVPGYHHTAQVDGHPRLAHVLANPVHGGIGGPCRIALVSSHAQETSCRAGEILETSGPATLNALGYSAYDITLPASGTMRPVEGFLSTDTIHKGTNGAGVVMGGLSVANGATLMSGTGVGGADIALGILGILGSLGSSTDNATFVPGAQYWAMQSITAVRTYPTRQAADQGMVHGLLWSEQVAGSRVLQQAGSRLEGKNAIWAPAKAFYRGSTPVSGVVFQGRIAGGAILKHQDLLPVFAWTQNLAPITPRKNYAISVTWISPAHRKNIAWARHETKELSAKWGQWIFVTRDGSGKAWICQGGKCRVEEQTKLRILSSS